MKGAERNGFMRARLSTNSRNSTTRDQPYLIVQDRGRSLLASRIRKLIKANSGEIAFNLVNGSGGTASPYDFKVTFDTYDLELLYHPFVDDFRRRLALTGLDGLLRPRDADDLPQYKEASLSSVYTRNTTFVPDPVPKETVDFEPSSAYGVYNWEIFFHAPFLIANRLRQEGRYAEAREWYHKIFDPTDGTGVPVADAHARHWKFRPFAENIDLATIQTQLATLSQPAAQYLNGLVNKPNFLAKPYSSLQAQIDRWRKDPFDPHAIAGLRRVAYQKAVVLKYIENLVAWGDDLFTQDTMETVNQAAQLYVHALQILGRRPQVISKPTSTNVSSYNQLGASIDAFGNAFIETEGILSTQPEGGVPCTGAAPGLGASLAGELYFCVPENEAIVGLWDTIEDRLFKIRNCQNIERVVRQLPLFQPPIDPALLVRARAAGVDLNSVLRDLNVSAPPYRYAVLAARAMEYTNALTSLGSSFLSALEKRDAEELSLLRSKHEIATQETTREIRRNQVEEAKENLASLKQSKKLAEGRRDYYSSRALVSPGEGTAMAVSGAAGALGIGANLAKAAGAAVSAAPDYIFGGAGAMGSPLLAVQFGANNPSRASIGLGDALQAMSSGLEIGASIAGTMAGYQRRFEDWQFQAKQAEVEIEQIEKQIIAAEIRVALAQQELRLLEQNLRQSKEIEAHLRTKFTNRDLYGWMVGQLSSVYFQSYKLAYEMARQAERAFQRERGDDAQTFIKFGAWDGVKRGLLAGEKLGLDLRRMDAAYHTQNRREHELTKTVSLSQIDPEAFLTLRESTNGSCNFSLPEALFDEDFPGHYLRRIKSVNVTLQCNPGPYQSVYGTLTLNACGIRKKPVGPAEPDVGPIARMVTSGAMNDSGLFEFNFRDERYLPFEYRGVHSDGVANQWNFALSKGNEFNYDSISDLVLQMRYTARDGRAASSAIWTPRNVLMRIPETHADLWAAFKESGGSLTIPTKPGNFPKARGRNLGNVTSVIVYAKSGTLPAVTLTGGTAIPPVVTLAGTSDLYKAAFTATGSVNTDRDWTITIPNTITDLWLSFSYTLT